MRLASRKQIDAPRSIVWSVTENIESWPRWTPTVTAVKRLDDGPFEVGSVALLKQPGLPAVEWRVTAMRRGHGFTWEARARGIRMVATHELEPAGAGTLSLLRLEMSGIAVVLLGPLLRPLVRRSLERENAGLKKECEARAASR